MELDEEPTKIAPKDIKRVSKDTGKLKNDLKFKYYKSKSCEIFVKFIFPPKLSSQNLLFASYSKFGCCC